jgi:hypothetical protein
VSETDALARLRALGDEPFVGFVADLAVTLRDGATVTVAPPSPAGGVDAVVETDDERLLFHVSRLTARDDDDDRAVVDVGRPGDAARDRSALEAAAVEAVLDVADGFDAVVVAATGPVTDDARAVAAETDLRILDGSELLALADEADVPVPSPETMSERFDRLVERQAAEWPESLRERATALLGAVDDVADFGHRIVHAAETTDVDFVVVERDEAVVRARLTETSFLVYVRDDDGQFDTVVTLSAFRRTQPPLAELLAELRPVVSAALSRKKGE